MARLPLDPRHGTHAPTTSTPDRLRGSIRRTTSVDMLRPNGLDGELVLHGRARDLRTDLNGDVRIIDEATIDVTIDFKAAQRVTAISSNPSIDGIERLIGVSASTGFRAELNLVVDGQHIMGRPVYQLLDDVPVACLISGYAFQHSLGLQRAAEAAAETADGATAPVLLQRERPKGIELIQVADLCAGWKSGGTIMTGFAEGTPPVVTGPDAPSLARTDDPLAWHAMPDPLPAHGMRRRRRIDLLGIDGLAGDDATAPIVVDGMFRDSHMDADGVETIVHEYTIGLRVDPRDWSVVESEATPRVLPWFECPEAAASAMRLAHGPLADLRVRVRADFLGPTTCTHLNDALRAFEDIPWLVRSG